MVRAAAAFVGMGLGSSLWVGRTAERPLMKFAPVEGRSSGMRITPLPQPGLALRQVVAKADGGVPERFR